MEILTTVDRSRCSEIVRRYDFRPELGDQMCFFFTDLCYCPDNPCSPKAMPHLFHAPAKHRNKPRYCQIDQEEATSAQK
jgi:hypothetical protein